jgi:hypothetical protein
MTNTQSLAERIAQLLEDERPSTDMAALMSSIEEINARLAKLEAADRPLPPLPAKHPSLDKFAIAEAIADQIIEGMNEQKACTFEPNGRPCDHCSMCSSRGF